jgi:hypothetical protein
MESINFTSTYCRHRVKFKKFINLLLKSLPFSRKTIHRNNAEIFYRYDGDSKRIGMIRVSLALFPSAIFPRAPYIVKVEVNPADGKVGAKSLYYGLKLTNCMKYCPRGPYRIKWSLNSKYGKIYPCIIKSERKIIVSINKFEHGPSFTTYLLINELSDFISKLITFIVLCIKPYEVYWTESASRAYNEFQDSANATDPEDVIAIARSVEEINFRNDTKYRHDRRQYNIRINKHDKLLREVELLRAERNWFGPAQDYEMVAEKYVTDKHQRRDPVRLVLRARCWQEAVVEAISEWLRRDVPDKFMKCSIRNGRETRRIFDRTPYDMLKVIKKFDEIDEIEKHINEGTPIDEEDYEDV